MCSATCTCRRHDKKQCDADGCTTTIGATKRWCSKHYQRWWKFGDPNHSADIRGTQKYATGSDHHRWAGDAVGEGGRHKRVQRARGWPYEYNCVDCGAIADHWSTIHGRDGLDVHADYEPRCESCHAKYDDKGAHWRKRGDADE